MAKKLKSVNAIVAEAVLEAAEQIKTDLANQEKDEKSKVKATDAKEMAIMGEFDEKAKEEEISSDVPTETSTLPEAPESSSEVPEETVDESDPIADDETKEELDKIDGSINYNFLGIDMVISNDDENGITATFTKDGYTATKEITDDSFTGIMKEIESFIVEYHENSGEGEEEDPEENPDSTADENATDKIDEDEDDETSVTGSSLLSKAYKDNKDLFMEYAKLGYAFKKYVIEAGEKLIFETDIKGYTEKAKAIDSKILEASQKLKNITENEYKTAKIKNKEYKEKYVIISNILSNAKTAIATGKMDTEKIKLVLSSIANGFNLPNDRFVLLANKAQEAIKYSILGSSQSKNKEKIEINNKGNESDEKALISKTVPVVNGGFGTSLGSLNGNKKTITEYDSMLIDLKRISGI